VAANQSSSCAKRVKQTAVVQGAAHEVSGGHAPAYFVRGSQTVQPNRFARDRRYNGQ